MISFLVNKKMLEMPPESSVTFKVVNPLFVNEIGYTTHSHTFQASDSAQNRMALGFLDHAMKVGTDRSWTAQAMMGGLPWKRGKLTVEGAQPGNSFSLSFAAGTSWLKDEIQNTRLQDLDLGGLRSLPQALTAGGDFQPTGGGGLDAIVGIRINNTTFSTTWNSGESQEDVIDEFVTLIQADADLQVNASKVFTGGSYWLRLAPNSSSIHFFVDDAPPITELFWTASGYVSSGEVFTEALETHLDAVAAAAVGIYPYCFVPVKNEAFYDGQADDFLGYVNLYEPGTGWLMNADTDGQRIRTGFVPFIQYSYLLQQALAFLGLTDISSFTSSIELQEMMLWNNKPLDFPFHDTLNNTITNWPKTEFNLVDHLPPGARILDLFLMITEKFGLAVEIDPVLKTIEFFPKKDVGNVPENWAGKSLQGYAVNFKSETAYSYRYDQDKTDALFSDEDAFQGIDNGPESKLLKLSAGPMFENVGSVSGYSFQWITPAIEQKANASTAGISANNDFASRVFWYHGMKQASDANTYPTGSIRGLDYSGARVNAYSLEIDGADGLYVTFLQPAESLLMGPKSISLQLRLDGKDLVNLDWKSPKLIRILEGSIKGWFREIEFTVGSRGLEVAKALIQI